MINLSRAKGAKAEEIAVNFLINKNYKILEKNYNTRYGEIDIICKKDNMIIFVEVKMRKSSVFGLPEETVLKPKIDRIRKTALIYLDKADEYYADIRFDVIAILGDDKDMRIEHIEEAF